MGYHAWLSIALSLAFGCQLDVLTYGLRRPVLAISMVYSFHCFRGEIVLDVMTISGINFAGRMTVFGKQAHRHVSVSIACKIGELNAFLICRHRDSYRGDIVSELNAENDPLDTTMLN